MLLLEHSEEAALGVVLNRPSDTELAAVLPSWAVLAAEPSVAFVGGPVQRDALVGLGRDRLSGAVEIVNLNDDEPSDKLERVRVFAGFAGWIAGQLDAEVAAGAWWVVEADPDDAMSEYPDDLWRRVLLRQPPPLRHYASFPRDPALN